jgi:hypothetical protein
MDKQKETELTAQGMADCMDMVRQELVEAGVVKADVAPMFLAEAVLSHVAALGADLRSTLTELTTVQRKLIDANAEIAALLLARDQTAVPVVPEPAETCMDAGFQSLREGGTNSREFGGIKPSAVTIPTTPEQAIAFIGSQFEVREDAEPLDRTRFQLTVHDLLSAFDWWFGDAEAAPSDGELYEAASRRADPAAHDAALAESLAVFGASAGLTSEHKAAQQAANAAATQRLDTAPRRLRGVISEDSPLVRAHRAAEAQAGQRESVTVTEKGPWSVSDWGQGRIVIQSNDFTHDVALEISGDFGSVEREIAHAEEIARRLNAYPTLVYTCIGKGGEYELIGQAKGAGTMRDHADLVVYRDAQTGQLYCRARPDFVERMQLVGSQR